MYRVVLQYTTPLSARVVCTQTNNCVSRELGRLLFELFRIFF